MDAFLGSLGCFATNQRLEAHPKSIEIAKNTKLLKFTLYYRLISS